MDSDRQETLLIDPGERARVWCKDCGRELKDETSRMRRLGPECDPDARTGHARHDVDQDPIPGL
jgi:Zn finger protein HypA/HybF involved in hydrogenase expression